MPARSDWSADACSIARGIDAVGDPWVLLVVRELLLGNRRFDGLRRTLGVADNVLSARLRLLVDRGLATREPYADGGRTRHEYVPTPAAEDVLPILHAFSTWAARHTPTSGPEQRVVVVCRTCGSESTTGEACSACGEPLTTASTAWVLPRDVDRVPVPLHGA